MAICAGQTYKRIEMQGDNFDNVEVVGVIKFEQEQPAEVCVQPLGFGNTISATQDSFLAAYELVDDPGPKSAWIA
jgi:hypothetical protein